MRFEICLENLRIYAMVGILPKERTAPQEILLNLKASYEADSTLHSNPQCVENLLDYATLRLIAIDIFKANHFFYLESALISLQKAVLSHFPQILSLEVSIKKLEIFSDCVPEVSLKWSAS